jgi:hypothetical protein
MVIPVAGDPGAPECSNVADASASGLYTKSTVKNAVEPDDGGRKTPVLVIVICKINRVLDNLFSLNYFNNQLVKQTS